MKKEIIPSFKNRRQDVCKRQEKETLATQNGVQEVKSMRRKMPEVTLTRYMEWEVQARLKFIGTTFSHYVVGLIVHDLNLPADELKATRNLEAKKAFEQNSMALDRIGTLLNKLLTPAHTPSSYTLTRQEVLQMLADHAAACKAHLAKGCIYDH